jgi:hypothetical protein
MVFNLNFTKLDAWILVVQPTTPAKKIRKRGIEINNKSKKLIGFPMRIFIKIKDQWSGVKYQIVNGLIGAS